MVVISLLTSCNEDEKRIVGSWAVEEIQAPFLIVNNAINFRKDHTCLLPLVKFEYRRTDKEEGKWKFDKRGSDRYVIITDNDEFAGEYKLINYHTFQDPESGGTLAQMTLSSAFVTMKCTKAVY